MPTWKKKNQVLFQINLGYHDITTLGVDPYGFVWFYSNQKSKWELFCFVLVDDFSRFTWVFFLEQKNQAFSYFQAFKKRVEKKKDSSILRIRSNRGGEFNNQPVITFCEEQGIKYELSCPRTPQQNRVVERKNRTL